MSKQNNATASGGIGFFGLLTILFIGLKLAGIGPVAAWPWLWVVSPLWIPLAVVLGIIIIGLFIWGISYAIFSKISR